MSLLVWKGVSSYLYLISFRHLTEADFRYNSRTDNDGERFQKAMGRMNGKRLTYDELTTSHLELLLPKGGELLEEADGITGI